MVLKKLDITCKEINVDPYLKSYTNSKFNYRIK